MRAKQLIPRPLHPLARTVLKHANLARGPVRGRQRGLAAEAEFWRSYLREANLAELLNPEITEPTVLACLGAIPGDEVSVIDVGAGPLSTLGTRAAGKRVRLTPVDPLAERYDDALADVGVTPLVRTQPGAGEDLLERFSAESFDLAFAANALDHAVDPLRIIRNMVALVRPGGFVVLNHTPDEAERWGYATVHHWNFREVEGRCILWRPRTLWRAGTRLDLAAELPETSVTCRTAPGGDGWRVVCVIEKAVRRDAELEPASRWP